MFNMFLFFRFDTRQNRSFYLGQSSVNRKKIKIFVFHENTATVYGLLLGILLTLKTSDPYFIIYVLTANITHTQYRYYTYNEITTD